MQLLLNSNSSSAEVYRGTVVNFLPAAKPLSAVRMSAFADVLGEAAWSHI